MTRPFQTRRSAEMDQAWLVGRNARIRGLDVKQANIELALKLGWTSAAGKDALLDECERAWHAEDLLRFSQ